MIWENAEDINGSYANSGVFWLIRDGIITTTDDVGAITGKGHAYEMG